MAPTPREILIPVLTVLGIALIIGSFSFFRRRHRRRVQKDQTEAQEKAFANAQDHRFMQQAKRSKYMDPDPELGGVGKDTPSVPGSSGSHGVPIPTTNANGELTIQTDFPSPVNREEDRSISPMNMEYMIRDSQIATQKEAARNAELEGNVRNMETWTRDDMEYEDGKVVELRRDTDSGTHSMSASRDGSRPTSAHSQTRQIFPVPATTTPESVRALESTRAYTEEEGEKMGLGKEGRGYK
jgi:type II secretory pathway pseudopilin PulG